MWFFGLSRRFNLVTHILTSTEFSYASCNEMNPVDTGQGVHQWWMNKRKDKFLTVIRSRFVGSTSNYLDPYFFICTRMTSPCWLFFSVSTRLSWSTDCYFCLPNSFLHVRLSCQIACQYSGKKNDCEYSVSPNAAADNFLAVRNWFNYSNQKGNKSFS